MTRTPAYLAALASSAVPGLDPVAVRAAHGLPGNRCDVGFVTDTQHRAWVVRVPTTPAVGAQLDAAVPLLGLISRRLPFGVPAPRGFAGMPEGRAMVYPFLHGRSVVLDATPPGPGVAAEIGRALAALHNVDRAVFEEAGVPVYDPETYRSRHLADLDRAAGTGHVPAALLSRWERALEDVSAWRFAPTPVHGDIGGGRLLVSFADDADAATATMRAITGWEHAKVADPADDLGGLVQHCSPETFESILEAYSVARIERPDRYLRPRARLASELQALTRLLDAVTAAEPLLISRRAAELRAQDEHTAGEPDLIPVLPVEPEHPRRAVATSGSPGAETRGIGARGDEVPPGGDGRDESQDTQVLKVGDAAEATTVIPDAELARLRSASTVQVQPAASEPSVAVQGQPQGEAATSASADTPAEAAAEGTSPPPGEAATDLMEHPSADSTEGSPGAQAVATEAWAGSPTLPESSPRP